MKQRDDELAIDFVRRVIGWLDCEQESLLQDLPSVEAVFEYAALWSTYDTDLMVGIEEMIEHHGADPKPLQDFIKKHGLNWDTDWIPKAA